MAFDPTSSIIAWDSRCVRMQTAACPRGACLPAAHMVALACDCPNPVQREERGCRQPAWQGGWTTRRLADAATSQSLGCLVTSVCWLSVFCGLLFYRALQRLLRPAFARSPGLPPPPPCLPPKSGWAPPGLAPLLSQRGGPCAN